MAGGIDWFRWHHGSVTDPKFQLVARKSGASLPDVLAVWAYLLEQASAANVRGQIGEVDAEALDCLFNFPNTETRTADILSAMHERGLLGEGVVLSWEKRQPKRERPEDNTAAERKRRQREAEAANQNQEEPCHATSHQETPRGEERREEEKEQEKQPSVVVKRSASDPSRYQVPDCPYDRLLDVYHEALPMLARVVVFSPQRKTSLRSRWVEVCAAEKYDLDDGVQWFKDFLFGIRKSKFLTGNSSPSPGRSVFKADLEWLLAPKNFAKVVEGRYHEEMR